MVKPKSKHRIIKKILYYLEALSFIKIVKNWYIIPLGYLGLINPLNKIVHLRKGLNFYLSNIIDAWGIKEVFGDNDYRLFRVAKPFIVVDIGANIGTFSILAASMGKDVKVFSYEPSESTYKTLLKNVSLNNFSKQISTFKFAVYSHFKKVKLFDSGTPGARSIFRTRSEENYEIVKTTTLAEVFRQNKIKVCDYLKIDCEGSEYAILSSCKPEIFRKIKRISLEFHELLPHQKHHQLVDLLNSNGFRVEHNYHLIENNIGYIYAYK